MKLLRSERIHISVFNNNRAFTLIEIIVVITLMGIMFFFAIPRLDKSMFFGNSRQVSSWIVLKVKALKSKAVAKDSRYCLHVDIDENRLWVSSDAKPKDKPSKSEDDAESEAMKKNASSSTQNEYSLPKGFRLLDVEFSDKHIKSGGTANLLFYPEGYSDRAIIHIENPDGRQLSYIIESFLPKVRISQNYVGF